MKPIIKQLINAVPLMLGVLIIAYIIEELVEEFVNDSLSDFIYPVAALVALYIFWKMVLVSAQVYLNGGATEPKADE